VLLASVALVAAPGVAGCRVDAGGIARAAGAAAPQAQLPQAGTCYLAVVEVSRLATDRPVDCAESHVAETAAVGEFTAAHADADRPPAPGSAASRVAFADCDAKVRAFAGGDWRGAAMALIVVLPDPERWSGGARWFRCDVAELVSVDSGSKKRTGSLRGVLKAGKPPVYTCFTDDEWDQLWPAACTAKHRYEFVGIWTAPDIALEDLEGKNERIFRECRKVINVFLGLPRSSGAAYQSRSSRRQRQVRPKPDP
jgi:hypothetical protein